MKLGYKITKNNNQIEIQRNTKETKIIVILNNIKNKKLNVETNLEFLNHMIETLAWNANLNIGVKIDTNTKLRHPIAEDAGITLGRGFLEFYKIKIKNGIEGNGFSRGIIDEAYSDTAISIEGRSYCFIEIPYFENVEDVNNFDLKAFLEGFTQGCRCTLQIRSNGKDPHHTWEAVFRSLGQAIRKALKSNNWRKNTIIGLKGTLE